MMPLNLNVDPYEITMLTLSCFTSLVMVSVLAFAFWKSIAGIGRRK